MYSLVTNHSLRQITYSQFSLGIFKAKIYFSQYFKEEAIYQNLEKNVCLYFI
jgi:hypothetical protein